MYEGQVNFWKTHFRKHYYCVPSVIGNIYTWAYYGDQSTWPCFVGQPTRSAWKSQATTNHQPPTRRCSLIGKIKQNYRRIKSSVATSVRDGIMDGTIISVLDAIQLQCTGEKPPAILFPVLFSLFVAKKVPKELLVQLATQKQERFLKRYLVHDMIPQENIENLAPVYTSTTTTHVIFIIFTTKLYTQGLRKIPQCKTPDQKTSIRNAG